MSFTCEELVTGVSNPAFNPNASASGFQPNWGVPAVPINPPLIYEPPPSGTGGVAQIWVGASGINGGGGSQWGGANVYISTDNVTYSQIAVITAPMRQGLLTAESYRRQPDGIRSIRSRSILEKALKPATAR